MTIRTRVENTSADVQAVDIGDVISFGDDEAEPFTVPAGFDRRSDLNVVDAIGSSHETRPVSFAVHATTPLVLLRGSSVRDQLGGDGSLVGYIIASAQLEPGGVFDAERVFAVGRDVDAALEPRWDEIGIVTRRVTGEVRAAGAAVAGARISVFSDLELRQLARAHHSRVGTELDADRRRVCYGRTERRSRRGTGRRSPRSWALTAPLFVDADADGELRIVP